MAQEQHSIEQGQNPKRFLLNVGFVGVISRWEIYVVSMNFKIKQGLVLIAQSCPTLLQPNGL